MSIAVRPMPSPSGRRDSNFVVFRTPLRLDDKLRVRELGHRGMAYDSKGGLHEVDDSAEEAELDRLQRVLEFLENKLQPEDLRRVATLLGSEEVDKTFRSEDGGRHKVGKDRMGRARDWLTGKGMSEDDVSEFESMMGGKDQPVPFKGMPQPGGKIYGQDAARRLAMDAAAKRFERLHPPAMDSKAQESYAKRFPHAATIRVLG
jgi:hypothetical protein